MPLLIVCCCWQSLQHLCFSSSDVDTMTLLGEGNHAPPSQTRRRMQTFSHILCLRGRTKRIMFDDFHSAMSWRRESCSVFFFEQWHCSSGGLYQHPVRSQAPIRRGAFIISCTVMEADLISHSHPQQQAGLFAVIRLGICQPRSSTHACSQAPRFRGYSAS